MLRYLLDEQISPVVAIQLSNKHPHISVASIHHWRGGRLLGAADPDVLLGAIEEGLTIVTYDLQTIPGLLMEWSDIGQSHGGAVLVDQRTIAPDDIGQLIRALARNWTDHGKEDWRNRIAYLKRL